MTQKFLGHPLSGFRPTDSSATHIKGQWKTMCAGITPAAAKARSAQDASQFAAGYAAVRL